MTYRETLMMESAADGYLTSICKSSMQALVSKLITKQRGKLNWNPGTIEEVTFEQIDAVLTHPPSYEIL